MFCFVLPAITFKNPDFCTDYICVFRTMCRINSDYFSKQHNPVGPYGGEEACLLWGKEGDFWSRIISCLKFIFSQFLKNYISYFIEIDFFPFPIMPESIFLSSPEMNLKLFYFQHKQRMTWLMTLNERERLLLPWDGNFSCGSITKFFFRKITCLHYLFT